jgi:hypothetical protein
MKSSGFDSAQLERLRQLQKAHLPGNIIACIGFPTLFLLTLLIVLVSFNRSSAPSIIIAAWITVTLALVFVQRILNSHFENKNTIRVRYILPREVDVLYERLLKSFDKLSGLKLVEIGAHPDGGFEQIAVSSLQVTLPKYLRCNLDVFSLALGDARYYFLPDCILTFFNGTYRILDWSKVSLRVNDIAGNCRFTEYQSVLVHGRYRKDGGLDRRFNSRYQQVPRQVMRSLRDYGVLSFKFGKEKVIVLTTDKTLISKFGANFGDWVETR